MNVIQRCSSMLKKIGVEVLLDLNKPETVQAGAPPKVQTEEILIYTSAKGLQCGIS